MPVMRIIAGPNGSGKTQLTTELRSSYDLNWGYYINADEIEKSLRQKHRLSLRQYGLGNNIAPSFEEFYQVHPLRSKSETGFIVLRSSIVLKSALMEETYFPTLVTDFLRHELIKTKKSFSFETVMSGKDKVELLRQVRASGYRTYLYYICTENALINIDRVADRVRKKGHYVPAELIKSRYERSLLNLLIALKLVDRAFLFDNSGREHKLFAEVTNGSEIKFDLSFVPRWFSLYVLSKL